MTKVRFLRNLFGETVIGMGSVEPFYQLYGEVQVERTPGSGIYSKTAGFLMDPLPDLTNHFILNSGFRGHFLAPSFNPFEVTEIEKVYHNILKGKFYKSESYGDPPEVETPLIEVEDYLVLNGGISNGVGFDVGMGRIMDEKKFLSWHPEIKRVGMNQPELLHFLVFDDEVTEVNLHAKVVYTDGTEATIQPLTLGNLTQYDLLRIPVGMGVLELGTMDFTKMIEHWEVWLVDQGENVISESRFYELDHDDQPFERFWMYENGLGMPEIFRTVGKSAYRNIISHYSGRRSLGRGYDVKGGQYFVGNSTSRAEQEISSGPVRDRETAFYLLDFLSQKGTLYELRDGDYFPMTLAPNATHEVATDEDFNYFLRFVVRGAFDEQSYTPN